MRAPHGEQVRHAGTVLVPYGNNVGTMWEQLAGLRCCEGISAIFKRLDYGMQGSCPCIYIQRDGIRSRREMAARESLASQGRRREPGRQRARCST